MEPGVPGKLSSMPASTNVDTSSVAAAIAVAAAADSRSMAVSSDMVKKKKQFYYFLNFDNFRETFFKKN